MSRGASARVPLGTCSAHFTNSDDTVARQQAAGYALIGVFAISEHRWLAGDFNLEPGQLPALYAGAENITCDVERCPTIPSAAPTSMIDYVSATPSSLHGALDPGCFTWASNDCLVRGRPRWEVE